MRPFIRQAHRPTTLALAALVVAALSHCSWEEARELTQRSRSIAFHRLALPSPVEAPVHDCDHEYGCICRGATVIHAVDVELYKAEFAGWLLSDLSPAPPGSICDDAAVSFGSLDEFSAPPLSGRQLRALYASLVI
jgi:hypothetical protein